MNNAFGWQLLTSILSICIHIIATPYFLLLDLFYPAAYGSADIGFLLLQVVWIITHHIHLLLLVMPASAASFQVDLKILRNSRLYLILNSQQKSKTKISKKQPSVSRNLADFRITLVKCRSKKRYLQRLSIMQYRFIGNRLNKQWR